MSKAITLTITEDERAELEALLDAYLAEVRKEKGELAMEDSPTQHSKDERAHLEALLDDYLTESRSDQGEHERRMARVDQNLAWINRNLAAIRANREQACGKSC